MAQYVLDKTDGIYTARNLTNGHVVAEMHNFPIFVRRFQKALTRSPYHPTIDFREGIRLDEAVILNAVYSAYVAGVYRRERKVKRKQSSGPKKIATSRRY